VLIWTDIARAVVLAIVPLAWAFGWLHMELLYLVAFVNGALTLFFNVAYISYMPSIVPREDLVAANARMEGSASTAQVAGPGLGGILVGILSAPAALLINTASYLVSALFLSRIAAVEPPPEKSERLHLRRDIGEGIRIVWADARLRAILLSSATVSLFGYIFLAVYVLYMLNDLSFSSTQVGLVLSLGGVGAVIGAVIAGPLTRRIGIGRAIIVGRTLFGVFGMLVPLAVNVSRLEVPMVLAAEFLQWMALIIALINEVSVRQTLVPERLLGRATATYRFLGGGMIPIGSIIGGLLGEMIGLRETLIVGCIGMLLAGIWVAASPLRGRDNGVMSLTATITPTLEQAAN
ncbi:MAG: MFS transporter, partial [Thermomicrobiales bacterium]|nr:MFS transporter [Thermomicrobiales bacterium]